MERVQMVGQSAEMAKWYANIKKLVAQKKLDKIITGDTFNSFQSEGSSGYYYIHNSEKLNIKNTLEKMVKLMEDAISATKQK